MKSDIALMQSRARMRRPSWVEVMHAKARDGSPKVNTHVVAPMPDAHRRDNLIATVNGSSVYGRDALAEPVTDLDRLKGYLLWERAGNATGRVAQRHPSQERLAPARRVGGRQGQGIGRRS